MTVFSIFGYWRTGRSKKARKPRNKIRRLTTAAKTGRLMKMSVNFIVFVSQQSCGGTSIDRNFGRRFQLAFALVDHDRLPVVKPVLTGLHHLIARIEAAQNRDFAVMTRPGLDEALHRFEHRLA